MVRVQGLLRYLTADKAMLVLVAAMFALQVVLPLVIYFYFIQDSNYLLLAGISALALLCMQAGNKLGLLDQTVLNGQKLALSSPQYITFLFVIFVAFCAITLGTAPSIPILSALSGADVNTLSAERGEFLKGRTGAWVTLSYVSSILTSTFIPYAVVLAYATKSRLRHALLLVSLFYSVCFLVKALFLNLALPLISYAIQRGAIQRRHMTIWMSGIVGSLVILSSLAGYGSLKSQGPASASEYFSSAYVPSSSLDFLVYRSIAVPVFSVVDTFFVHQKELRGELLWGSTSTFVTLFTGADRVNLERMVSAYQYGGWNDYANSNVIFTSDGYVNFGIVGVIFYGLFVGVTFRIFRRSKDPAMRSMAILYAYLLYFSPLLGMLLSNGFLLLFAQALFVKVRIGNGARGVLVTYSGRSANEH
jgi:hypothetical protein